MDPDAPASGAPLGSGPASGAPASDPSVSPPTGPDWFAEETGVSRETLHRLTIYVDLLREWQSRKNLVSEASLSDVWRRHVLDSAQLFPLLDEDDEIVDLGSGAGFPGLVLAIMGMQNVRLVESNHGKSAFLRAAADATGTAVEIWTDRAEQLGQGALAGVADVVTARAVGPLTRLLPWIAPIIRPGGCALLLKGARTDDELNDARSAWRMRATRLPSRSDPSGTILRLEDIRRADTKPRRRR